jgi:hypothetical protein
MSAETPKSAEAPPESAKASTQKPAPKKPKVKKSPKAKPAGSKKDLNKSDEIRKVATKMRAAGEKVRPKLIVEELAKRGITVAPAQVSMVLKGMGFKPLRKRKKKAAAEGTPKAAKAGRPAKGTAVTVEDLLAAKKVVDAMGGAEKALRAIEALRRLEG